MTFYVTNEARRMQAWGPPCGADVKAGRVRIASYSLTCHRLVVPAFEVFDLIREKHGYWPTGSDTGFYSCRHMRHDPSLPWSAHAWATALDLNWLQNPAGSKLVTDMPKAMITELQTVKTKSGVFVWMWGGDWDRDGTSVDHTYVDAMHWEVIAHPLDLATGFQWNGKLVDRGGHEKVDGLKRGDRGNAVKALQRGLNAWHPPLNLETKTGIYGDMTAAAVRMYQEAAELPVTGDADDTTLAFILSNPLRSQDTLKELLSW